MMAVALERGRTWMEARSRSFVVFMSLAAILFLWTLDLNASWSLLIFYLLPLILAASFAGLVPAALLSVVAATGWLVTDLVFLPCIPTCTHVADYLSRLALFLAVVYIESSREDLLRREQRLSSADPLTGTYNRRAFTALAEREIARQGRSGRPMSLAYIDVDDFKRVNDRCGHEAGDGLLCAVAGVLRGATRRCDLVARMGGDEFAVLFPETGPEELRSVLERVREELGVVVQRGRWGAGFSIGAVTMTHPPYTVHDMIHRADQLMYGSKQGGKSRLSLEVQAAPHSLPEPTG